MRHYTKDQDELLLSKDRPPLAHLAKMMNRSIRSLQDRIYKLKVAAGTQQSHRPFTPAEDALIISKNRTKSWSDIARLCGRLPGSVYLRARRLKEPRKVPTKRKPFSPLEDRAIICNTSLNLTDLARRLSRSKASVFTRARYLRRTHKIADTRKSRPFTKPEDDLILSSSLPVIQIAKTLNRAEGCIYARRRLLQGGTKP